ncbi:7SK snRNA methylphosphate capping enzyme-like isoform X1 [Asterias rubens]|uniref:7SK snRNA methylphosphate capping enzyme-like isoform X1 n=1 Tax=Asterias rubens TaxID=7604 RepID=UPI0014552DDD|nr:7SK snRNA methylphosphate capping enzyme-like isoform X1 [Asterias rubens]
MSGQAETFAANAGHTDSWDKRPGTVNTSSICGISGSEAWSRPDDEGNFSSYSLSTSTNDPPTKHEHSDNCQQLSSKQSHDTEDASTKKKRQNTSANPGNHKQMGRKRRKTSERNTTHAHFLMGGCMTDPLNLNSLCNEEISRVLNAATPISSPLPHVNKDPNPVIVPIDVTDPLQLNTVFSQTDDEANLTRTLTPKSAGKKRKKRTDKPSESHSADEATIINKPANLKLDGIKPLHHGSTSTIPDKIVSPVLPDCGPSYRKRKKQEPTTKISRALLVMEPEPKSAAETSEKTSTQNQITDRVTPEKRKYKRQTSKETKVQPKFKDQNKKFQYGNYHRYYGYRNPDQEDDPRVSFLKRDWFQGKTCLDIGCNSGHVTLFVAKTFSPERITGIDIDPVLIGIARKNILHCLEGEKDKKQHKFPASMEKLYGPITPRGHSKQTSSSKFPGNILFRCANYVPENEAILELQKPEYDTILCLSVTKWIHLNWGDAGLKKMFRRVFLALRPGGRFILEPQAWPSYTKKKKLTETIYKNYKQIQLKPDKFKDYLLSSAIGFSSCETIGTPLNKSKGFCRPILMFTKLTPRSSTTKSSVTSSKHTSSKGLDDGSTGKVSSGHIKQLHAPTTHANTTIPNLSKDRESNKGNVSSTDPSTSFIRQDVPNKDKESTVINPEREIADDSTTSTVQHQTPSKQSKSSLVNPEKEIADDSTTSTVQHQTPSKQSKMSLVNPEKEIADDSTTSTVQHQTPSKQSKSSLVNPEKEIADDSTTSSVQHQTQSKQSKRSLLNPEKEIADDSTSLTVQHQTPSKQSKSSLVNPEKEIADDSTTLSVQHQTQSKQSKRSLVNPEKEIAADKGKDCKALISQTPIHHSKRSEDKDAVKVGVTLDEESHASSETKSQISPDGGINLTEKVKTDNDDVKVILNAGELSSSHDTESNSPPAKRVKTK